MDDSSNVHNSNTTLWIYIACQTNFLHFADFRMNSPQWTACLTMRYTNDIKAMDDGREWAHDENILVIIALKSVCLFQH